MKTSHYFAYGSNLHPIRLSERIASASFLATAKLQGYRFTFHKAGMDNSGKGHIQATGNHDDCVYGAVYTLTSQQLQQLHKFEGGGYQCEVLDVNIESHSQRSCLSCFTYIAKPGHIDAGLQPFHWYKEIVLMGASYHRFPADYISKIAAAISTQDPHPARRQNHEALIRRLRREFSPL